MTEPFRIRHARPIVLATTAAILLVFAGVAMIRYSRATNARNTYLIQADQAQLRGLRKTMDVRILGEPVGVVTDVRYRDDHPSHVEVEFSVSNPERNKIYANSRVIVARTLTVGTPFLEIERATDMLGMIVRNLSNEEANQLGTRGVMVVEIAGSSPASQFDLQLINQVITSVNGTPIDDVGGYYQTMGNIVPGSKVALILHTVGEPITLDATMVTSHRLLHDGSIVQQFEPEESSVQTITDKITLVQESIAKVEQSLVASLSSTSNNVDQTIVPAFQSIASTSDAIRGETLSKANDALDKSKDTLNRFDQSASNISESVVDMVNDSAIPAFDQFNAAAKSLNETSLGLRNTVDAVGNDTGAAIEKLTAAIETLQAVLDKSRVVAEVLEREAQDLPGTAKRINGTMQSIDGTAQKAQTTIDGINNHWLLRRSIKRSQDKTSGQKPPTGPVRKLFNR